jgi:nucleoside-triphosphatase THEP1
VALEAAVETLPWVMANLPRLSETFRRPITIFHQVVAQAEFWLKRLTLRQARRKKVLLFSGQVGQGKSGLLDQLLGDLRREGMRLSGILSPSVHRAGERIGYDLIDLGSGERCELSRVAGTVSSQVERPRVGLYAFLSEGIAFGLSALSLENAQRADLILVDEVGPWELCDQGWASALYDLTLRSDVPMIWVVRADIVDQVAAHWGLEAPGIVKLEEVNRESMLKRVKSWMGSGNSGSEIPLNADNPQAGPRPY